MSTGYEKTSKWHTERDDYDYRYHWDMGDPENTWWVEYRKKAVFIKHVDWTGKVIK